MPEWLVETLVVLAWAIVLGTVPCTVLYIVWSQAPVLP